MKEVDMGACNAMYDRCNLRIRKQYVSTTQH